MKTFNVLLLFGFVLSLQDVLKPSIPSPAFTVFFPVTLYALSLVYRDSFLPTGHES